MSLPTPARSHLVGWLAVTWLLFACFTFYVSFVQYALLGRAVQQLGLSEADLAPGFALLALFGIAGTLLAGRVIDRRRLNAMTVLRWTAALSGALAVCAVVAMQATGRIALIALFAPMGLVLGLLIVCLLHLFSTMLPGRVRGLFAGLCAGLVYFAANVLALYSDKPDTIGLFDLMLVISNIAVVFLFHDALQQTPSEDYGVEQPLRGWLVGLLPLAAVVLIDTALFVHVSRAPGAVPVLADAGDWLRNGIAHLLVALIAGVLYARLGWRKLTFVAAAALTATLAAFVVHRFGLADLSDLIMLLYSVTVGVYTVALFTVFGEAAPRQRPAMGIAWGMVVVGWVCSPAGIALGTALLP